MTNELLFPDETVITQADNDLITLTNYRLRYYDNELSRAHLKSILLEKVSSVEVHFINRIWMLAVGVLALLSMFLLANDNANDAAVGSGIVGVMLIVFFLTSRKHVLTIASDGGTTINFHIRGMDRKKILDFVNKVEWAAVQRSFCAKN